VSITLKSTVDLLFTTAKIPVMPSSPKQKIALGTLLLATALSVNLIAEIATSDQPDPSVPELTDTSFDEAINHGVAAFRDAHYATAVQHFKIAVIFDPTSAKARLYLGTAYAYQVVPNLDTPDNFATANNAIDTFKQIPEGAPEYSNALKQIASVYRNIKRLDESKAIERQFLKLEPNDAETHYTIGVLDWMQSYKNALQILAAASLRDDGKGNPDLNQNACLELSTQNSALVQDGIDHLTRAIDLKPNYADAMQYLQLTYRRHADLACGDDTKRTEDLAQADLWSKKAMDTRRQNESSLIERSVPK
jgi:tetratricopeptide (TPR) repeat protein